ncbi:BgTH12-04456 [Blumeria graminis f. sp. triticale]|uniref:BgTH12-04456 n=1 Tax=Blumeria graminis f. sp. triticale TaxID=1689686 RepID=A0A9W4CUR2_BLUGR|nr:BgTH12-04456 [Blumeria graminis f. sp. triticale]
MGLGKLYVNPQDKFGAKHYEVLENKPRIFFEKCRIAGVGENQFKNVFSTMLRDAAHDYYFRHLAEHLNDLSFDEMVHKTKERFHTKTEEQNYLTEWRALTLLKVIRDNPEKNTLQCLDLVIEKLQKIYEALRCNYSHKSHSLAGQLYAACQGVSACAQALIRPHDGFENACAELQSTVKIHMDCAPRNTEQFHQEAEYDNDKEDNNGQLFVDRRYRERGGHNRGRLQGRGGFMVDSAAITTAKRSASCVKRLDAGPLGTHQANVRDGSRAGGRTWRRTNSRTTTIPWVCLSSTMKVTRRTKMTVKVTLLTCSTRGQKTRLNSSTPATGPLMDRIRLSCSTIKRPYMP